MADQTADFFAGILQDIDAQYGDTETPDPPPRKRRPRTPVAQLTHEIDGWEQVEHLLAAISTIMVDDLPRLERETAALHREREALVQWLNTHVGTTQATLDRFGANLRRYGRLMIRLKMKTLALEQARARSKKQEYPLSGDPLIDVLNRFR